MSELSDLAHELRTIAGDDGDWVAGPISASVLREAADTIESMRVRLQEEDDALRDYYASQISAEAERRLQAVGETNYERLFGTPEKAARTLTHNVPSTCDECVLVDICEIGMPAKCMVDDRDALLEWLRGDA